jgi:MFS family permease
VPAFWLAVVLVVVLSSGGLFGYDQGVISGALTGIRNTFAPSPLIIEVVTSWVTLGALMGALAGGELADRIGRKRAVLIAGALFTLAPQFRRSPLILRSSFLNVSSCASKLLPTMSPFSGATERWNIATVRRPAPSLM